MRRAKVYIPLILLLVALAAAGAAFWKRSVPTEPVAGVESPSPPRVTPGYAGIDVEALNAAADYAGQRGSLALIVWRGGHIVYEKYWGGSDFNTVIDSGGFSATLVAMLVGIAQSERKIALLEEPVTNYVPEWGNTERQSATLRDLLHGADPQPLVLVLERATGQRHARYLSERLWQQVGAGDARLRLDQRGLFARQGDWIRIGAVLVSDGLYEGEEIVPPGWVKQMLAPAPRNPNFGFQLQLGEPHDARRSAEPYATRDVFFLAGFGKNRLWLVPSLGLVVLRTGENRSPQGEWDDARIPNLVIRGTADYRPGANAPADLKSLVPNH